MNDNPNGKPDDRCKYCAGIGIVRARLGDRTVQEHCKHCGGTGKARDFTQPERLNDPSHPVAEHRR